MVDNIYRRNNNVNKSVPNNSVKVPSFNIESFRIMVLLFFHSHLTFSVNRCNKQFSLFSNVNKSSSELI